jgi:ligand-binding sensor domain-containing protein
MKSKYILLKLLLVIYLFPVTNWVLASANIRFLNLSPEKIPELAYVLSMHVDGEGYLWFGTYNGLVRYDGSEFQIFAYSENENSLSNSVVQVITEDDKGNLWIGTEHGLNKYDKRTNQFTNYINKGDDEHSLSSTHIRTIYIENDSIMWLGMRGGGLSKFNFVSNKLIHFRASAKPNSLSSDDINCFYPANDSIFLIGTENGGLFEFNKYTSIFKPFLSLAGKTISYVHVDTYNNIWAGVWDVGLFKKGFGDTTFQRLPIFENTNWTPKDIKEDAEGNLWIGSFGNGLLKYDPKTQMKIQFLPIEQSSKSLAHNRIWSMLIDGSQNIWIGSFGNGVSFYDKYANKFPFIKTNIENPDANIGTILSVAEDKSGSIWMLTNKGLFEYLRHKNRFKQWNPPPNFKETIHRIFCDNAGYLWLGCNGSMVQLNVITSKFRVYNAKKMAPQRNDYFVNYIEQDRENNIWFSIYEAGLYMIPNNQIELTGKGDVSLQSYIYYKDSVVIPSNIIWQIKSIPNGTIWITTNSGFCKLDPQKNKFESVNTLAHSSLYSKNTNTIWLGSLGAGLGKYELSTQPPTYYSKNEGLASDIVYGVSGDNEGNLWLITQKGISKFNPINQSFKNYDASDGIEDIRFSMNSTITLSTGEMLCYSNSGFTIFNPKKIIDNPNTPKVVITDIKLYNRSITMEYADSAHRKLNKPLANIQKIEIDHNDKMLTINFNALFYSSPDHLKYAYQLQGFDSEWNYTTSQQRNATYTNLAAGNYLFIVKAANSDGIWSEKTTNLEIVVIPPIWKTLYFRIILLIIIVLMVYLLIKIQYNKIKKRYAFEEIKKERELIRMKIDKLDSELEQKSNELTSKTLVLLHKNEKIRELKNRINEGLSKVSVSSQPFIYSLLRFIQVEFENDQFWDQFEA